MPIKASAKKALRQSIKRGRRNLLAMSELHSLRVKFRKLSTENKLKEAGELARLLGKKLDKAFAHGVMKKNTAARYKSRLMKKLHALSTKA